MSNVRVCVCVYARVCVRAGARLVPVCTVCVYVRACLFLSLTLAGRQEERRANQRARFHKSWLLIGQEGKGTVNKEKSLSGTAPERAPAPRLGRRRSRPLWGLRPVPPCVSACEGTGTDAAFFFSAPFLFFVLILFLERKEGSWYLVLSSSKHNKSVEDIRFFFLK